MSYGIRLVILLVLGIVAIAVDRSYPIPAPPDWLIGWAAWFSLGLALIFGGGKIFSAIGAALFSRESSKQ